MSIKKPPHSQPILITLKSYLQQGRELNDIAKSKKWELVSGSWEAWGWLDFMTTDLQNPGVVWAGDTIAADMPSILKTEVILGLTVGVFQSEDGGDAWHTIFKQGYTHLHPECPQPAVDLRKRP